ncbi:hypothetical protein [Halostagnicola bangensis]
MLTSLGAGVASLTFVGTTTARDTCGERDWQCSGNDTCGERDWQCQAEEGYQYSETVGRSGPACEFTNQVVFPILTAASMEDGIPISTKVVASGWAASSTACYAMDQMEEYHEQQIDEASVHIQSNDEHTLMMPE